MKGPRDPRHHPPAHPRRTAAHPGLRRRSSFSFAFAFLPPEQRTAFDAVYAFCRLADDAVDEATSGEEARARLANLRERLGAVFAGAPPAQTSASQTPTIPFVASASLGNDPPARAAERSPRVGTTDGISDDVTDEIAFALQAAVRRFPIRREHLEAVIEGCEWDIDRDRYATWDREPRRTKPRTFLLSTGARSRWRST